MWKMPKRQPPTSRHQNVFKIKQLEINVETSMLFLHEIHIMCYDNDFSISLSEFGNYGLSEADGV